MSSKYWNVNSLKNKAFLWQYKDIELFKSLVRPQKNEKVLDVGCAFSPLGQAFYPFVLPDGLIHGIDIDPDLIVAVKEYVKSIGREKNFAFTTGDAYTLSQIFFDSTFDIVMCQQLLINVSDPLQVILEMKKVCNKDNGRILAVENCNLGAFIIDTTLDAKDMLRLSQIYQKIVVLGQHIIEGGDTTRGMYISQYFQKIGLYNIQSVYIIPNNPILEIQNISKQHEILEEQAQENVHLIKVFSRWAQPLIPELLSYDDWIFFKDTVFTAHTTREKSKNNQILQFNHPLVATIGWMKPYLPETDINNLSINI